MTQKIYFSFFTFVALYNTHPSNTMNNKSQTDLSKNIQCFIDSTNRCIESANKCITTTDKTIENINRTINNINKTIENKNNQQRQ